jgi:SRSO17 transposase
MTYLYYKTSSYTSNQKPNEKTIEQWKHLADKKNWRITQLPNGFYQTEVSDPNNKDSWHDVTRRETIEGAEAAIDGSVDHFLKKLEAVKGPKVIKTF